MNAIEARSFERVVYDGGEIRNRQTLSVGAARVETDSFVLPIEIETIRNGVLQNRVETRWTCTGTTGNMAMSVLAFGPPRRNVALRIDQESPGSLYPSFSAMSSSSGRLADLAFELRIEEGVFAALGGRTELRLTDRSWETLGSDDSPRIRIRSKVDARSFLLGIRIRRTKLESLEILDPVEGLLRHELRRDGETWSVVTLLPAPDATTPYADQEQPR